MSDLQEAQAARDIAEHKLAAARAEVETMGLERARRLMEAPEPVMVPWSEYPGMDDFSRYPGRVERPYIYSDMQDRTEGRYLPLYETEHDLRAMRAESRTFYASYPIAQGLVDSLTNYVLGNGWEFNVKPKVRFAADPVTRQLTPIVQTVLDKLLERNNFVGDLDREIHKQGRVDGECFAGVYPDGEDVRIELLNPDYILKPLDPKPLERFLRQGHKLNYWWHGVHTQYSRILKRDDVTRPLGYHLVFDRVGDQWDYLPAYRVEHVKRNVGRDARRGVSDYVIIKNELKLNAKIRRNTGEGAAILAAIVMIRQHAPGVARSTVEAMVSQNADGSYVKGTPSGNRTANFEHTPPGTVKDVPAGMTHEVGPLGQLRSPVYIEVAQYIERIIGTPRSTPEYLVSGDASNANYASTLVAEGPFVKAREQDQGFDARHLESLLWKGLKLYHELGAFGDLPWHEIVARLDLRAEYTSPASRDRLQQIQVNEKLSSMGIMSDRTLAADMGLDLDEELANGASKPAPQPLFGVNPMAPQLTPQIGPPSAGAMRREAMLAGIHVARDIIEARAVGREAIRESDCGANAEGGGGFQQGNDCAGEGGGGGEQGGGKAVTDTPEFKAWFGESKVVDENGRPVIVHHGTRNPGFTKFEVGDSETGRGIFFTDNVFVAEDYAAGELDFDEDATGKAHDSAGIYSAYLRMENPKEFDVEGKQWFNIPMSTMLSDAAAAGHDGVIMRNIRDAKYNKDMQSTGYVVFAPKQIKSATGNKGTFNPDSDDIRESLKPHA